MRHPWLHAMLMPHDSAPIANHHVPCLSRFQPSPSPTNLHFPTSPFSHKAADLMPIFDPIAHIPGHRQTRGNPKGDRKFRGSMPHGLFQGRGNYWSRRPNSPQYTHSKVRSIVDWLSCTSFIIFLSQKVSK